MPEVSITGMITTKAELGFYDKPQLNQFLKENINKKVIITVQALPHDNSAAMRGYYYKKLIPDFVGGFYDLGNIFSPEECDEYLRSICPLTIKQEYIEEHWQNQVLEISDLDNRAFVDYIEWLHRIYSEYMNVKEKIDGKFSTVRFNYR